MSMLLRFMNFDSESCPDKIAQVEAMVALVQSILQLLGTAPYLGSLHYIWKAATLALIEMEEHFFPGCPVQTSNILTTPTKWLPMSRLKTADWDQYRPLLYPGYYALKSINDWVWTEYDKDVHKDLYISLADAFLLLETAFEICEIPLDPQNTVILEEY